MNFLLLIRKEKYKIKKILMRTLIGKFVKILFIECHDLHYFHVFILLYTI